MKSKFGISFWNEATEDYFEEKVIELVKHGYTEEEAIEFMADTYVVVGSEYGDF